MKSTQSCVCSFCSSPALATSWPFILESGQVLLCIHSCLDRQRVGVFLTGMTIEQCDTQMVRQQSECVCSFDIDVAFDGS